MGALVTPAAARFAPMPAIEYSAGTSLKPEADIRLAAFKAAGNARCFRDWTSSEQGARSSKRRSPVTDVLFSKGARVIFPLLGS